MDALDLEISRENWKLLSIILIILITFTSITAVSYNFGFHNCEKKILYSGYSLVDVHTQTNSYFEIERKTR